MAIESNIINQLVKILNELDVVIGKFPVYIYLIDNEYTLVWCNHYFREKIPDLKSQVGTPCYRALWNMKEECGDCAAFHELEQRELDRRVIRRVLPATGEEVFLEIISLPVKTDGTSLEGVLKIGLDVSTIEKKQLVLREREKLFTSMIETSADAIFFLDNTDQITSWNKGAETIFGYSADEVIGKSIVLLVPKELIELGELIYIQQELKNKGHLRKYETQRLDKNGRLIYVDLTRTLVRDENGNPLGSSVILKDITSRKELEFELLRTILELSKLNELNEILYTTYNTDEILRIILIAITAGEGLRFNRAFLCLVNNREKKLQGHLAIGPADENEANRIWGNLKDHFQSLKDSVNLYKINVQETDYLVNEMVHSIEVPLDDEQNLLIRSLNSRRVFHVRNSKVEGIENYHFEINGKSVMELLGTSTFVVAPLFTKREPLGVIIADNRITKKDTTPEDIESLKLFAHQASLAIENVRLYKNLEDRIAELQEAYRKLEENAARLVQAERLATVGEMSAKVAHEIRNPLVSIGGFARLLEKKLPDNSELKNYSTIISTQVSNLETILNNLLRVANPKKPVLRKVNIHEVFHQVLIMMDGLIQKRGIQVHVQFECPESVVWGDEKLLHQAFLNLVKNAVEAMTSDGILILETGCDNDFVRIMVKDNGKGIPENLLNRIYELFFTTKAEGTGLGLPIVRQIIEDHNGHMEIKSLAEKGTTVEITIPRYKEDDDSQGKENN